MESQLPSWMDGSFFFDVAIDPHNDAPVPSRKATCRCSVMWCNASDNEDLSQVEQYFSRLKPGQKRKAYQSLCGSNISSDYLSACVNGRKDLRIHLRHVPVPPMSIGSSTDAITAWVASGCLLSKGTDASLSDVSFVLVSRLSFSFPFAYFLCSFAIASC